MKIFLSSTFIDLVEYRAAAVEALEKLDQQIGRMEIFNANPNEPTQVSLNELKKCDILIGIYAHRYGTIPEGYAISITEIEYNYAREIGLPCFCFLVEQKHPWNPEMMEKGKQTKLKKLKKKIKADLVIEYFTAPEDLALKVSTAIGRHLSKSSDPQDKKKTQKQLEIDINKIKEFERDYLKQVGNYSKLITIPHFDRAPRIHINKIFVNPNFILRPMKREDEHDKISYEELLESINHTVVIGDPGAGKSTLAQKICYELSENYEKKLINNTLLTPILIVLRDYSAAKEEKGYSIVEFAESEVTSKYQLPKPPPDKAFETLLKNGDLIMIFDGLDELLITSKRREITKDIESFCNLYPDVLILVTSRVVGYEQAPLDPSIFKTYIITPFDLFQIREYTEKWFDNKDVSCRGDKNKNKEAFLRESEIATDLRSNPLMLALMCNLYRGAGFIPRNRPELYRKCSEMLFERWDPSRGIWIQLPISEPKALLSRLAYWIYSQEALLSGISESQLISEATKFLYSRSFEIEEEAERASKDFINFCRGRAWVFTDVGTTPDGQIIYKFTHKTFLEYFTAVYIVRTNNAPNELWSLLHPKIIDRSWDVVAQLCFQMLYEQVEGASNILIDLLLKEAKVDLENHWSLLSFGARCLKFIHPSPKIIRNLTEACIINMIEDSNTSTRKLDDNLDENDFRMKNTDLLAALTTPSQECRKIIANVIQEFIKENVNAKDKTFVRKLLLFGLILPLGPIRHRLERSDDSISFWQDIGNLVISDNIDEIEEFIFEDFTIFCYWSRFKKPDNLVELIVNKFSIEHLFIPQRNDLFTINYSSFTEISLALMLDDEETDDNEFISLTNYYKKQLLYLEELIMNMDFPCFSYEVLKNMRTTYSFLFIRGGSKLVKDTEIIKKNIYFGLWSLLVVYTELLEREKTESRFLRHLDRLPKILKMIILARLKRVDVKQVLNEIKPLKIKSKQKVLIEDWIQHKFNMVG